MPSRLTPLLAAAALMALLATTTPSGAQTEDDLDEVEEQQEELAGELEALEASYEELEAAIAAAEESVRQTEAAKREAQQRVEAAQAEVRAAEAAVVQMRRDIAELEAQASEEAVAAYIHPDVTTEAMETDDIEDAAQREALLTTVTSRHTDVLDRLGGLEVDLVDAEEHARDAEARVVEHQAEVEVLLAAYQAELEQQQVLQAELDDRIAHVQEEADALAAEEDEIRAALAAASQAPTSSGTPGGSIESPPSASGLIWPVSGPVTSPYGQRWGRLHAGIDIGAPAGTPIYAANSGTVISGCGGGYGNCVMIDHGGGFVTLYAHQTTVYVSGGESVSRGQNIGTVGCTGSCTGDHLHFETRINGSPYDPLQYLP